MRNSRVTRATLTSKGQITIPTIVRDRLGLATGDAIDFVADRTGGYTVRPLRERATLQRLCDEMLPRSRYLTVDGMRLVAAKAAIARHRPRTRRRSG